LAQVPRFQVEDIERLFRALIPSGQPDPFGRIEEIVLALGEEHAKDAVLLDKNQKDVGEELEDIKSRTFGILFLQVFKTLSFFLRLLPQGKIILLAVAIIGLLTTVLQDGDVSGAAIRDAVRNTGLAKFIDDILEELKKFTTEIADNVEELSFAASDVFASVAIQLDANINALQNLVGDLSTFDIGNDLEALETAKARMSQVAFEMDEIVNNLVFPANAASNSDLILGPALRALDDEIRTIPTLALKLVRFG